MYKEITKYISSQIDDSDIGESTIIDAFVNLETQRKELESLLKQIKDWKDENISYISEEAAELKDGYKGWQFEVRGGKSYSYKHIPEWIEIKEKLTDVENKCKQAFLANQNKLMVASEDGEEVPYPEITYRKGSVIMKPKKMKFKLSENIEVQKARVYLENLISKEANIELIKKNPPRSLSQNSYLHVCISLYAIHFGYTLSEAKTLLKRACDFMTYQKEGQEHFVETSKSDSKLLSQFTEWIRNYSSVNGCYIPSSEEYLEQKFYFDREVENHKTYL